MSFDVLRTLEFPGVTHIKPDMWLREQARVRQADWVLYPEYWQVNALVYGWQRRIFPSVSTYHLGHDKVEMTRAFQAVAPAHTPATLILPSTPSAVEEVLDLLPFPFVAKSTRSSMGEGVFRIEDRAQFAQYARNHGVLYVQELLPIERDLRVVWIGDEILCAYWREAPPGRFHNNVARGGQVSFERVPAPALALVREVATALGIDHAGFDLALVEGHPYLIEFNVKFGTSAIRQHGLGLVRPVLDHLYAGRGGIPAAVGL